MKKRWKIAIGIVIALAAVLFVWLITLPPYWSRAAWAQQLSSARSIEDYDGIRADIPYSAVVVKLGTPDYFGPGFRRLEHVDAGVVHWEKANGTEIRCLVIDDRLVGTVKVGTW